MVSTTANRFGGIIGGVLLNDENAISIDQSIISGNAYLNTTSTVGISYIISTGVKERSSNYMKSKYFLFDLGDNYKFINGEDYPVLQWQEGESVSGAEFLQIANEIELHEFEEIIEDKAEKYRGKRVELRANIAFASDNWKPIGNLFEELGTDGTLKFQGNLVSNGYKIAVTKTDSTTKVYSDTNNFKD